MYTIYIAQTHVQNVCFCVVSLFYLSEGGYVGLISGVGWTGVLSTGNILPIYPIFLVFPIHFDLSNGIFRLKCMLAMDYNYSHSGQNGFM